MSYTTSGISILSSQSFDLGRVITVLTTFDDKYVQCYVSGRLVEWQYPSGGMVEFVLTEPREEDAVFLLAVDEEDAGTNFWAEAFGVVEGTGNRITVQTPQEIVPYGPYHKWKVYLGQVGAGLADLLVHQQDFYPAWRNSGGWGLHWGRGGWGWNGFDCAGWGNNWGVGEWGFDCLMLSWTSQPLTPGEYPIKVVVEDGAGNESIAAETTVDLLAWARPASAPTITSYNSTTDTLVLSFNESEDLNQ